MPSDVGSLRAWVGQLAQGGMKAELVDYCDIFRGHVNGNNAKPSN